jgi:protein SCO1/2
MQSRRHIAFYSQCRWLNSFSGCVPVVLCLALLLGSSNQSLGQPITPKMVEAIGIDQKLDEQLPLDLKFTDEQGQEVLLQQYFGNKPVILVLAYYECPMLCTQVLNGLLRGLRPLSFDVGGEFNVVTVSFDPGETAALAAAKKNEYVKRYGREGAAEGWHFLTGAQDQIDQLTQAVGFRYEYDAETDNYIHASGVVILTPKGKLARYFYGVEFSPKDLRFGLIEATNEQIGNPVDQLLLLCFQYDPQSGKYNLVIMNTLRVAGFATLAVMGSFVFVMVRRDHRKKTKNVEA